MKKFVGQEKVVGYLRVHYLKADTCLKKRLLIKGKRLFLVRLFVKYNGKFLPDKSISVTKHSCSVSVILLSATALTFLKVYFKD
jgi:hypothetical protein